MLRMLSAEAALLCLLLLPVTLRPLCTSPANSESAFQHLVLQAMIACESAVAVQLFRPVFLRISDSMEQLQNAATFANLF